MAVEGMKLLAILLLFCSILAKECLAKRRDYQAELFKYLKNNITDYSPKLRPTLDPDQEVEVHVIASPGMIVSVDSAKQSMTIAGMFFASWYEERLVWDPRLFGNVTAMDWDGNQLWFPVIFVYNGMGDNQLLSPQFPPYITSVQSNLSVVSTTWRQEWEFSCEFNMTRFPLDRHICDMELFMNSRESDKIVLRKGLLLANSSFEYNEGVAFARNSEWRVLNLSTFIRYNDFKMFKNLPPVKMPNFVMLCGERRGGSRTAPEGDLDDSAVNKPSRDDVRTGETSGEPRRSEWQVAEVAVERLLILLGCPVTLAITFCFLIFPFL